MKNNAHNTSPVETKAEFARRLGVNRSTVTRGVQQGRILVNGEGLVLIRESLASWEASKAGRVDMEAYHAQKRGHGLNLSADGFGELELGYYKPLSEDEDEDLALDASSVDKARADVKAEKVHFENQLFHLEQSIERGNTLIKSEFEREIADIAKALSSGLDRITDNLAPQLVNKTSKSVRRAMVDNALSGLLTEIAQ